MHKRQVDALDYINAQLDFIDALQKNTLVLTRYSALNRSSIGIKLKLLNI